jgi:hypothetical protein
MERQQSFSFYARLTLISWLSMLGFDLFLHGGLLAGLYAQPHPFLLSPERSFALIPLGYLSFLLLAVLLVWLMVRLDIRDWRQGVIFALKLGFLAWGSLSLGLLSISTIPLALMLGWLIGQTVELGIAGAVAGIGLSSSKLGKLFLSVIGFVVVMVILTIVLQNIGFAPAPVIK